MTFLVAEVTIGDHFLTQQNYPKTQGKLPHELVLPLENSPDKENECFQKKVARDVLNLSQILFICVRREEASFLKSCVGSDPVHWIIIVRKVNDDCQPICSPPVIDRKNIYLRNKKYPRKKTVEIEKCYFCCPSVHYVKIHFGNS